MKKYTVFSILVLLSACALCACGKSKKAADPAREVSQEEMGMETGIVLSAPVDASDVKYLIAEKGEDKKGAQVDFSYRGKNFSYRAEMADGLDAYDMTGLQYDWDEQKEVTLGSCTATLELCSKAAGLYWIDIVPGINYSLGCDSAVSEQELLEVADLVFESLQDSVLENAVTIQNLAGVYRNGDPDGGCDEIILTDTGDGQYDFSISLFRLAGMEGTGIDLGGAVDITMTDPNGNEMRAVFYSEGGTYSILISGSSWDYLEEGSVIEGFVPVE